MIHETKTAIAVCLVLSLVGSSTSGQTTETITRHVTPLTIAASTVGRFSKGASWFLSVNSAGQAELEIWSSMHTARKQRTLQITQGQIQELEQAIEREKFFDMAPIQGQAVPDGSWSTLTIVRGDRAHTVRIGYLMNWVHSDQEKLREPARAVRVFRVIRSWFNDPEAVDGSKYDQMVLDAVPK